MSIVNCHFFKKNTHKMVNVKHICVGLLSCVNLSFYSKQHITNNGTHLFYVPKNKIKNDKKIATLTELSKTISLFQIQSTIYN